MKIKLLLLLLFINSAYTKSQITPAGFDHTKFVSWEAFGINQSLDSANTKSIFAFIGVAKESRPDDLNLFERPGIFVSDQCFQHKFRPGWKYAIGMSYRIQHHYVEEYPYYPDSPEKLHEVRAYSSIIRSYSFKHFKWEISIKEEWRNFYTKEFTKPKYPIKLRSRFKSKLRWFPFENKIHAVIFQSEALFSTHKESGKKFSWSSFRYSDTRLSIFYSLAPKKCPFRFEVGYMNQLHGLSIQEDINFVAFNLIWANPFSHK